MTLKAISRNLLDLGLYDKAYSVINGIKDNFHKAGALIEYCNFISHKNEVVDIENIILESFDLVENLDQRERNFFYSGIGFDRSLSSTVFERCYVLINRNNYKKKFFEGISKKIKSSDAIKYDVNPYLYLFSDQTKNLSNILFYQAKIACFFEKDYSEKKLDMLSEVLDFKDWRRISAIT